MWVGFHRSEKTVIALLVMIALVFLAGAAFGRTSGINGSDASHGLPPGQGADLVVGWAVANDVDSGVSEGRCDPSGIVTRAQTVNLLYRTVEQLQSIAGANATVKEAIVFSVRHNDRSDIFMMNPDGTNPRPIP